MLDLNVAMQAQDSAAVSTAGKSSEAESARRLARMVETAAEYEITAGDGSQGAVELRQKPLLRWSNPLRETDDGALFLWTQGARPVVAACVYNVGQDGAQGTDPEIMLLLEAHRGDEKSLGWRYAVARMNMAELDLKHAGRVVWKISNWDRRLDPRQPYITFAFGRGP